VALFTGAGDEEEEGEKRRRACCGGDEIRSVAEAGSRLDIAQLGTAGSREYEGGE